MLSTNSNFSKFDKIDAIISAARLASGTKYVSTSAIAPVTLAPPSLKEMNIKMPPVKELEKKWAPFKNHVGIYKAALQAYNFMGKTLNSREFTGPNNFNMYEDKNYISIDKNLGEKDENFFYMKLNGKTIETKVTIQTDINVRIDLTRDQQSLLDAETILKTYFPSFKLPSKWEKIKNNDNSLIAGGYRNSVSVGEDIEVFIPIEQFPRFRPKFTLNNSKDTEKQFILPKEYNKSYNGIAQLKLTLKQSDINVSNEFVREESGTFTNSKARIFIRVEAEVLLNWPVQFAYYATCANSYAEFIPFLFFQYITWHRVVYSGKSKGEVSKIPSRINNMNIILDRNKKEQAKKSIKVVTRTNEDEFLIMGVGEPSKTGEIYWIPSNVNKIPDYVEQIKKSYNQTENKFDLSKVKFKGEGLFTDFQSDKFSYFREEGISAVSSDISGIQTLDLTGSVPLDPVTIALALNKTIIDPTNVKQFEWLLSIVRKFLDGNYKEAKPKKNYTSEEYLKTFKITNLPRVYSSEYICSKIFNSIRDFPGNIYWKNIGGAPLLHVSGEDTLETKSTDALNPLFINTRGYLNVLKEICKDILDQFDNVESGYASKIDRLKFTLTLICRYADLHKQYDEQRDKALEVNETPEISNEEFNEGKNKVKLANLAGVSMLMPHQLETSLQMTPSPLAGLISVDVGGGKCADYNTLIPTSIGLVKIGEIYDKFSSFKLPNNGFKKLKENFKVIGLNGRDEAIASYKTKGKTVVLETSIGDELESLKEHRFHSLNMETGKIEWKHVENIKTGDWLPKNYKTRIFARKVPTYIDYNNVRRKLTPNLARILGFLVSEGYVGGSYVSFCNSDQKSLDLYKNDFTLEFGHIQREDVRENNNTFVETNTVVSNKSQKDLLVDNIGLGSVKSSKKEIPLIVRQAPEQLQLQFLKALFEGDGGIYEKSKNRFCIEYYSTSKKLSYQVKMMLENIGIFSEMRKSMKGAVNGSNTKKLCYTITISQQHYHEFSTKIGFISKVKSDKLKSLINHRKNLYTLDRNYNSLVHGFYNKLPVGKFVNTLLDRMQLILLNFNDSNHNNYNKSLSIPWVFRNASSIEVLEKERKVKYDVSSRIVRDFRKNNEIVTRYSVYRLIHAIKSLPKSIRKDLYKDFIFNSCYSVIKNSTKMVWAKVVNKNYRSTPKSVYDISIKNSHAYVANGYMSHNTLCTLIEVCRLIQEGNIKKALIVVPGNLVRNWVNEINYFSKGKINPFALTTQSIRKLQYAYNKIADNVAKPDYVNLRKIIDSCPPNTIFISNFRFLINDKEDLVYGSKIINRLYTAEFIRSMNFDYVGVDESHFSKNLSSMTTLGVSIVLSAAKYKRALSGTVVNNTLKDLVGQTGIMVPPALGSESSFLEKYSSVDKNKIGDWRENAPELITTDMKPYIKRIVHKKQEWSAFLPPLRERFHNVEMTDKQREFYVDLLRKSVEDIKKKNPKLYAQLIDGNESDAGSIQKGLATYFAAIEQFLYAPDSNEAFVALEDVEPEDLVSPKIAKVVEIIDQHFKGFKDILGRNHEADTNKIIIFSHRRKTSIHVMKYLPDRLKKIAVRYEAGDFKSLQSFLENDKIKILVADEISINTGQNLQIASRIIRLETLWAPGNQEQGLGRIWRPAFKKDGSSRKEIFMDWIYTIKSLDEAKVARLISKIITKTKYDHQDNPKFTREKFDTPSGLIGVYGKTIPNITKPLSLDRMLGELPLIKMNSKTILSFSGVAMDGDEYKSVGSKINLYEYFGYYALINSWEDKQFEFYKDSPKYSKLVDLPKSAYVEIPNSKAIPYIPRVPGVATTLEDPDDKMGYKPISVIENSIENEDDEDEEIDIEVNPVELNQIVNTEFGFGKVTKILKTDVWVDIKGLGEVKVPKSTAWVITNPEAEKQVKADIKKYGEAGNVKLPAVIKSLINKIASDESIDDEEEEEINVKPSPQDTKKPKFDEFDHNEEEDDTAVHVWSAIIDTKVALIADATLEENSILQEDFGFKTIQAYSAIKILNSQALKKVLGYMTNNYVVPTNLVENFEYYKLMLQNHSMKAAEPGNVNQTIRFFTIQDHKRLQKNQLHPYPIIWKGTFYMAFNKANTPALLKFEQKIRSMSINGAKIINQDELYVKFYSTPSQAIEDLNEIHNVNTNPDYKESLEFLKSIVIKVDTKKVQNTKNIDSTKFNIVKNIVKKQEAVKLKVEPKKPLNSSPVPTLKVQVKEPDKPSRFNLKLNLKGIGKIK